MNWYHSSDVVDHLAAAYALGTLSGRPRRRFEAVMRQHPQIARQVAQWDTRLQPMAERLPPRTPSEALWGRIEQRAFGAAPAPAHSIATPSWWRRLLAPLPTGALVFGLMLGLLLPTVLPLQDTQLPESYVGVLATPDGKTGLIVSSRRHGKVIDLKQVQPVTPPAGHTLYLWAIDASGSVRPIGAAPAGAFVQATLPKAAEFIFSTAVELAVSIEPIQMTPTQPSGPFVYRGLCGKLWKAPPPR
jgi:anti-sigma-K factor RskA